MKKTKLSLLMFLLLSLFIILFTGNESVLASTTTDNKIDNFQLMSHTGITVGEYRKLGDNIYTIRFRNKEEVTKWRFAVISTKIILELKYLSGNPNELEKLRPSHPLEFTAKYGALSLFEEDNGYSLLDGVITVPLRAEWDAFNKSSAVAAGEAQLRIKKPTYRMIYNILTGGTPEIVKDFMQYDKINYSKTQQVNEVLRFILTQGACPDYDKENGVYYCAGEEFAKDAIYDNDIFPITEFNGLDLQINSSNKFPKLLANEEAPEFTNDNLKKFIYDAYNLLTDQEPKTDIKEYVKEALKKYRTVQQAIIKASNLVGSDGMFASQGEWIYYAKNNAVYREKLNGSSKAKLYEGTAVSSINVEGNYIYYENYNLYRMKLDGSEKTKLTQSAVKSPYVHDGWIYYFEQVYYDYWATHFKLVKMKIDGTQKHELYDFYSRPTSVKLQVIGDSVYFSTELNSRTKVFKVDKDGNDVDGVNISLNGGKFVVDFEKIYFTRNDPDGDSYDVNLISSHIDGTNQVDVSPDDANLHIQSVVETVVHPDYIFYLEHYYKPHMAGEGFTLWRINKASYKTEKIADIKSLANLYITNDTLFLKYDDEDKIVRIPIKLDMIAPGSPIVNPVTSKSVTITGKAEKFATIHVYNKSKSIGTGKVDSYGNFKVTIKAQPSGSTLTVYVKDPAGNQSASKSVKVLDKTPPSTPIVNTVTSKTVTITGKAEKSATVYIYNKGKSIGTGKVDSYGNFKVTIKAQPSGSTLTVYVKDPAGNQSVSKSVKVLDKTAPAIPTVNKVTSKTVTIKGKAEKSATVYVYNKSKKIGSGKVDSKGYFKVKIKAQKKKSTLSVYVKDKSGNKSKVKSVRVY